MKSDGVYKDLDDRYSLSSEGQYQEAQHGILRINIDDVYESDLHALRWLQIENFSNEEIIVKLKSNLGNQIAFQLSNENLACEEEENLVPENDTEHSRKLKLLCKDGKSAPLFAVCMLKSPSNLSKNALEEFPGRNHNQLFNNINHITEIELYPKEIRRFVLAFLPNRNNKQAKRKNIVSEDREQQEDIEMESYGFYEVSGLLFFLGYKKKPSTAAGQASSVAELSRIGSFSGDKDPVPSPAQPPDYKLISKFKSRVCLSMMRIDIEGAEISFPACTIGTPCYKDFTLTNCSAVKLFWTLNAEDLFNKKKEGDVSFTNPETNSPIEFSPVMPYSHRKIRVAFVPKEVGEFNYEFQLENVANGDNFITVSINTVVRLDQSKEPVVITPDTTLDFGSCYTGKWTGRKIYLRSESELPVEVLFHSDVDDVKFRLKGEDLPLPNNSQDYEGQGAAMVTDNPAKNIDSLESLSVYQPSSNSLYDKENTVRSIQNDPDISSSSMISDYNSVNSEQKYQMKEILAAYEQKGDLSSLYDYTLSQMRHSLTPSEDVTYDKDVNRSNEEEDGLEDEMEEEMEDEDYHNQHSIPNKHTLIPKKDTTPSELSALEEHGVVEEIVLRPGTERTIEVLYRQKLDPQMPDFWGGHLIRRDFKIYVHYSVTGISAVNKKTIHCKAFTCTSFIQLDPDNINFSDTYINTQKSKTIKVKNMSDLPAKFICKHSSKILYTPTGVQHVPPNGEVDLKIQIDPRKTNPDYKKVIKIINLYNKSDEQQLDVRSTNVEMGHETLNLFFYRVILPTPGSTIDFGASTCNSQSVRTFRIFNISKSKISLSLSSSSPSEVEIYKVNDHINDTYSDSSELNTELRERTIEIINPRNTLGGLVNDKLRYMKLKSHQSNILSKSPNSAALDYPLESAHQKVASIMGSLPLCDPLKRHIFAHHEGKSGELPDGHHAVPTNHNHLPSKYLKRISFLDLAMTETQNASLMDLFYHPDNDTRERLLLDIGSVFRVGENMKKKNPGNTSYLSTRDPRGYTNIFPNDANPGKELICAFKDLDNDTSNEKPKTYQDSDSYSRANHPVPAKQFMQNGNIDPEVLAGRRGLPISTLLSLLESVTGYYPGDFKNSEQRELYVRSVMCLRRELRYAIKYGRLVPTSVLDVSSEKEVQVVLIHTSKLNQLLVDKMGSMCIDAKVYIKLEQYDEKILESRRHILESIGTEIPLFKLNLKLVLCSSTIRVNQKNINFGYINRHEVYKKSIVIMSYSDIPLLYSLTKSGSISSGDIIFSGGGVGIVPPLSKKRVEFTFNPTLPGNFHEIINVENVMNPDDSQQVSVKATVRERNDFIVSDTYIDFGTIYMGQKEISRRYITISNASFKTAKTFEITVNPRESEMDDFDVELVFEKVEPRSEEFLSINAPFPKYMLSKEAEEHIEVLEAKLEIAKRKCRHQTATKILKELQKLRSGMDFYRNDDNDDANLISQNDIVTLEELTLASPTYTNALALESIAVDKHANEVQPANSYLHTTSTNEEPSEKSSTDPSKLGTSTAQKKSSQTSNVQILSYRRGRNKISFTVASRVIQPIAIYLRLRVKNLKTLYGSNFDGDSHPSNLELPSNYKRSTYGCIEIPVTGSFQIYEYRNKDVIKPVYYHSKFIFEEPTSIVDKEFHMDDAEQRKISRSNKVPDTNGLFLPETDLQYSTTSLDSSYITCNKESALTDRPKNAGDPPVIVIPSCASPDHTTGSCSCVSCKSLICGMSSTIEAHTCSHYDDIDMGNTPLLVQKSCTVFLVYQDARGGVIKVELDIEESDNYHVTNLEKGCSLVKGEKKKIEFSFVPITHGQHRIVLVINFPQGEYPQMKLAYRFYAVQPSYITFPSLPSPNSNLLDIGYCYVDNKSGYMRVTKLPIYNCTRLYIYVSAKSNLSQQCFIKFDENMSKDLSLLKIPPLCAKDAYIVLRPRFFIRHRKDTQHAVSPEVANHSTSHMKSFKMDSDGLRKLTGGIKFMIYIPKDTSSSKENRDIKAEDMDLVSTRTLMFTAIVGASVLGVDTTFINFYSVKTLQDIEGSFVVKNVGHRLPLNFTVDCGADYVQILPHRSVIPARVVYDEKECTEVIRFKVRVREYGFYSPKISVKNVNNRNQRVVIKVWAFVDPQYISFVPHVDSSSPQNFGYQSDEDQPIIRWQNVSATYSPFVARTTDISPGEYMFSNGHAYYCSLYRTFEIQNISQNDLSLRLKSDLKLQIELDSKKSRSCPERKKGPNYAQMPLFYRNNRAGTFFDNGILFVRKGEKKSIRVSIPRLLKTKENLSYISNYKIADQLGALIFENTYNKKIIKAIFLYSSYCVPCIMLDTSNINIGRIGYANGWRSINFSFVITNISEIDVLYEISFPRFIFLDSILNDEHSSNEVSTSKEYNSGSSLVRYKLKALSKVVVNCVFNLKREDCTQQQNERATIRVTNLYNYLNFKELSVCYTTTTPGIEFDRIGPRGLILNPLKHPYNPDVLPSDAWFTIINTSDAEPTFELVFDTDPLISNLIKLTLHSRQSGTPMAGVFKLAPSERIELRLVAQAIDGTRIPSNNLFAHLIDPGGISYGKLRVLLRSSQHSSDPSEPSCGANPPICIEEIPINGVVIEGNTFKLSTDHLYLVNSAVSDNSDDETCGIVMKDIDVAHNSDASSEFNPELSSGTGVLKSGQFGCYETPSAHENIDTDVTGPPASKMNQLVITNLMKLIPLEFKFTVEYPIELSNPGNIISVSPAGNQSTMKIDPGGSIVLTFSLLDKYIFGSSEDVKVHFVDCASLKQTPQTLYISIGEASSSNFLHNRLN